MASHANRSHDELIHDAMRLLCRFTTWARAPRINAKAALLRMLTKHRTKVSNNALTSPFVSSPG